MRTTKRYTNTTFTHRVDHDVSGGFVAAHQAEIETLLRAEGDRAAADNPLGRILSMHAAPPYALVVRTSTEHLAQRLGHALHKAFQGDVVFGFSHENKFAHVTWRRD